MDNGVRFGQQRLVSLCQQWIFKSANTIKLNSDRSADHSAVVAAFQLACQLAKWNRDALTAGEAELAEVVDTMPALKPQRQYDALVEPNIGEQWTLMLVALCRVYCAIQSASPKVLANRLVSRLHADLVKVANLDLPSEDLQQGLIEAIYLAMLQGAQARYGTLARMTVDEGYEEAFFVGDARNCLDYNWVNKAYRAGRAVVFSGETTKPRASTTTQRPIISTAWQGPQTGCR